jgi:hypothetical protein
VKKLILLPLFLFLLSGCVGNKSELNKTSGETSKIEEELQSKIVELQDQNSELKKQLESYKTVDEETSNVLRETMNLTFKMIHAMQSKDYAFIEGVLSPEITLDKENGSFSYETYNQNFVTGIDFNNLEYRYHHQEKDTITIGFAVYKDESHSTLDFTYIKSGNGWKLQSFVTN